VLRRDPISGTGRQIQKVPCLIPKNILNGGILWRIEHYTYNMELGGSTIGIDDDHFVANMEFVQIPKDSRVATGTVQVAINHCAAFFARVWASAVPSRRRSRGSASAFPDRYFVELLPFR
jgi:hypothetical protein